jgi:hypothetical protein
VTDSITQANIKVLGGAPAIATGNLYEETAQALQNVVNQQTQTQTQKLDTPQSSNIDLATQQVSNFNGGQGVPGATTPTD